MRIRPGTFLGLIFAAAVLFPAPCAPAQGRGTLSISVMVARSLAVSVERGPSGPILSVRAPDGIERVTLLRQASSSPASVPASSRGEPDYLVITVLADAP